MSDSYFLALVNDGVSLHDIPTLFQFLKSWSQYISIYVDKILLCLQKNSLLLNAPFDSTIIQPAKAKQKVILKAARTFKKIKYVDNSLVVE